MDFSTLTSFWKTDLSQYSLAAHEAHYKRWRMIGIGLLVISFVLYLNSGSAKNTTVQSHIARIRVDLSPSASQNWLTQIQHASIDDNVKGILLFIDQSIMDSSDFAQTESALHTLAQVRNSKPVASFIYGYAHGNSYVIASATDQIVAQETASIGGISVVSSRFDMSELMEAVGVQVVNKGFGDYKIEPSKSDPNYQKFITHRKSIYQQMHQWMLDNINDGRHLSKDQMDSIKDGQWYTGIRAKTLGLCDSAGDIGLAENWVREHAVGGSDPSLVVVDYSNPTTEAELGLSSASYWTGFSQGQLKRFFSRFIQDQLLTALESWRLETIQKMKSL